MDDRIIFFELFLIILLTGYTIYNIYDFMPKVERCDTSFEIINNCSCIPDEYLAKLFNYKDFIDTKINFTELNKPIPLL